MEFVPNGGRSCGCSRSPLQGQRAYIECVPDILHRLIIGVQIDAFIIANYHINIAY